MELATAALGSLLPKLATLLSSQYKLHKGVRGEIRFLQAEMESMQAAIEAVSTNSKLPASHIDELSKIWVRDLRELCYDIEDSVDTFMVRLDSPDCAKTHSFRRFFDRAMGLVTKAKARHHIADDIEDIKRRIHDVADRRARYRPPDVPAAQTDNNSVDLRLPALYEDATKLVGIDGPVEKLVNLLKQGEDARKQELMVVSIVGVGGLGKTTIANSVYQRLKGKFRCHAFVSVSLRPDMTKILSTILRNVSGMEYVSMKEWSHINLINRIRENLMKKRYIVVIDDVWDESSWTTIKCALVDNNLGSRVIITTRNSGVAKISCSPLEGAMYELEPLSFEHSKRLFCKRIFNEERKIHSELEEISAKILKKCGGLPLAIITIASMLARLPIKTKYEWHRVYTSMGSGLEKDKSLENMQEILSLSYGDMPSYLKPCLLYLSMFPEDSKVPVDTLVRMWVAEGLVNEKQGENPYEQGRRYFNELVNRSMIQPIDMDEIGKARACHVHDMILDLLISLSSKENFVTISQGPLVNTQACKIRRLSLQIINQQQMLLEHEDKEAEQEMVPVDADTSHVRSVIRWYYGFKWTPPLSMFSVLRVLSLREIPRKGSHPKDLGSLKHLRFLLLGGKLETEFLEGIGNLKLLRTLDLRKASIEEVPASIVQLRKLEHLLVGEMVKLPEGIGNLRSLQELSCLNAYKSPKILEELGNLTDLRVLSIRLLDEHGMRTFLQMMPNLGNIRNLTIDLQMFKRVSLECRSDGWKGPAHLQSFDGSSDSFFTELPRWFSSLSELSYLSIGLRMLRQDDLQLLGALPLLRFLDLRAGSAVGTSEQRFVIGADQHFRSLTKFQFQQHGIFTMFAEGAMPKLRNLGLDFGLLIGFKETAMFRDIGFENLASLKHVTIEIDCLCASIADVEDVEGRIRDGINMHPSHPTLELSTKFKMIGKKTNMKPRRGKERWGSLEACDEGGHN